MSGLVRVELLRLRCRRAVLLLLAAAIVTPLVIAVSLVFTTSPPSQAELDQVTAQVEKERQRPSAQRQLARCQKNPGRFGVSPEDVRAGCDENVLPQPEWFADFSVLDLDNERGDDGSGIAVATILGVLMFLLGTTFVGHDWNTGSISNQLLFEPRRLRVWGAKAMAVTLTALVVSAVTLTAFWLVLGLAVFSRDVPVRPGALVDCLQQGGRSALLAAACALGGYALTMLSRSTVFTIGALFAVSVAGGLLLGILGPDDPGWLDPTINVKAVVLDGTEYYVEIPQRCYEKRRLYGGPGCDDTLERTLTEGAIYYGGVLVAVGGASALSFRRRDVP